jgi:hypothetical protein
MEVLPNGACGIDNEGDMVFHISVGKMQKEAFVKENFSFQDIDFFLLFYMEWYTEIYRRDDGVEGVDHLLQPFRILTVFDFEGFRLPSIFHMSYFVGILRHLLQSCVQYYPGTFKKFIFYQLPYGWRSVMETLRPFFPPLSTTFENRFVIINHPNQLQPFLSKDQLPQKWGGTLPYDETTSKISLSFQEVYK